MTCQRCGDGCQGRHCRDCERDLRFGNAGADQSQPKRDELKYECTECGAEYEDADLGGCPECGSARRRYIGEVAC